MANSDFSGELNIVIIGDFNPKIFQPFWFAKEGLIGESDSSNADISVVHPDITAFRLEWLDFQVTREKFIAQTSKEYSHEMLRDLVKGTFQLLSHTPVTAIGINFTRITNLMSNEKFEHFIEQVYPKPYWSSILDNPKLGEIKVLGNFDEENFSQSSLTIKPLNKNTVYTSFNYHFQISEMKTHGMGEQISQILDDFWEDSKEKEQKSFNTLFEKHT